MQTAHSQNVEECKKVVDLTVKSINNRSSNELMQYLSADFKIAGQKGQIAKIVLTQLLSQLGETVNSHKETGQTQLKNGLELKYNIDYAGMGLREATFIFNKNNLLDELNLFQMQVKTMNADTEIEKSNQDIIEIPFTLAGKLIAVDVLLNGETKKFILDSGSPRVILNAKYIEDKNENKTTLSSSRGVSGSISGMDIEKVEQLDFSGIQLNNQEVVTLDLSHLEESLGIKFYGLIGFDLIKDYDILYDYKSLKLTLINPAAFEKYKNENLANASLQKVTLDLKSHIPVVKAKVGNKTFSYGIDCGAESNLISDSLFESLEKDTKEIKTDELIGADNIPKQVKKGKIKSTTIGTLELKNLTTVFSDISHLNQGYNLNIDGLIGYEVLHTQKTLISYKRKEIIFIK